MQKLFKKVIQHSNRSWVIGFSLAALLVCASFGQVSTSKVENKNQSSTAAKDRANLAHVQAGLLGQPLTFEVNRGQTDAKVKYITQAQNFTVFLMPGETVMRGLNADVLRMKLQNANQSASMVGESLKPRVTNYFIGNDRSKWLTGVQNYGEVRSKNVYSGIDMVYHSDQRQLEYDFVVKPGADPNQIRMTFEGASKIAVNDEGALELQSASGDSLNHKPVVYQTINGHRKLVDGEYTLANNTVGFKLGDYDRTQTLVIDPTMQVLSFFGGTLNDEASGVAASAVQASPTVAGVVLVGRSQSPTLPGAIKPAGAINWDSFAVGLTGGTVGVPASAGSTLLWTTYFGGSGDDAARGVAMDNQGNVYISGYTSSSNFQPGLVAVSYDAYIVKLNASGGSMAGATLYGGPFVDQATSIALDYSTFSTLANAVSITNPATDPQVTPNVVIGGLTSGSIGAAGSPSSTTKTPDGRQTAFNNCTAGTSGCGTTDGFVAIFSSSLGLLHATYLGGGGNDQVNGVAVDVWGNVYATGFATPAVAPNFPVTNGIAQTSARANWDAATAAPLNSAVAFVAKFACTNGGFGVPSPPFGVGPIATEPSLGTGVNSQMPVCGGLNNLKTLSNSALFGGSGTFINPQQVVLGQNGVNEAGLGIAVDQNGWGSAAVAGVPPSGFVNAAGFPDIVPSTESTASCNLSAAGNNGFGAPKCAVSASNSATTGGFEPGVAGPHVYVVGSTANRNFVNSLVFNASCTTAPFVSSTAVPALCPVPEVWGGGVTATATLPTIPFCDPLQSLAPGQAGYNPTTGSGVCPTGGEPLGDLRVKLATGLVNSGQTQGWLASFQFPAVTQVVVTPPLVTATTTITTLNPPTIPNYIILQPLTCPPQIAGCIEGDVPTTGHASTVTTASPAPPANFGCVNTGVVTCPTPFLGSWNAVAVDSDQQVYVLGQIGQSPALTGAPPLPTPALFGTGAPDRLALEMERISPYANTPPGNVFYPNFCPGPGNAPCAIPEILFPFSGTTPAGSTTSFLVDVGTGIGGGTGNILNSSFGQILPGAPPFPNPNQPGGLGNGIAVNALREAFLAGTTTVLTPGGITAPVEATATLTATPGQVASITILPIAATTTYTSLPSCTITGGGGTGATCSLAAGGFTLSTGGVLTPPAPNTLPFTCSACVTAGGLVGSYTTAPTVTLSPAVSTTALAFFVTSPLFPPILPVPPTKGNFGASGSGNAGESCPGATTAAPCVGNGPEDVLFVALQFYDAIASPTTVNFTAQVNNFGSLTGPNGQTGANARAVIQYTNWEGQVLNVPPGCIVTPVVPNAQGGVPAFLVTPIAGTSSFNVSVNVTAATAQNAVTNPLSYPGVVTSLVTFSKTDACTGIGFPPGLDSWDPITLTLTVTAPLNLSPENTFGTAFAPITSKLASGIVDQYQAGGQQLAANQNVGIGIEVSTSVSNGPINFTAQIVPGQNWSGSVTNAVTMPTPTDIIYEATGPSGPGGQTRVPFNVNTQVLAGLPVGTYSALIVFTASPETPDSSTSGSTACNASTVSTVPLGSGTTSPACIPIVIQITPGVVGQSATLVFGSSQTPQQTQVQISNPTATAYTFTAGYQPTPIFGTALPASNVFFVNTASTLTPATTGNTVGGTVPAGGVFALPIQVVPTGLPSGVYSGQILFSATGTAAGATAQTTVPIIVYVGPRAGEDTPSGNGLGLMLPINVPPMGTGGSQGTGTGCPPTAAGSSCVGGYPIVISVPSGLGPNGLNQVANPTVFQVTGLNNTSTTSFSVSGPSFSATGLPAGAVFPSGAVTFTNAGAAFGSAAGTCPTTYSQLSSLPGSPLGPSCAWSLWVDATSLNATDTVPMGATCGINPQTNQANFGVAGTVSFSPGGFPGSTLVVPLTICVTDFPSLTLGMPNTYPNPTFGPNTFFNGSGTQVIAQPSNLVPGFQQSITDMVLAISGGGILGSTAAPVNLLTTAGNSSQVCKILDLRTNGGLVNAVTIAPTGVQWLTVQSLENVQGGALFLGPSLTAGSAPNSLRFNSGTPNGINFNFPGGITALGNLSNGALPITAPFSAGPVTINPDFQTFAICVNTDPVGNVAGTFSSTVTINGGGVGPITIPVNMIISQPGGGTGSGGGGGTGTPDVFSRIGIFRPPTPVGGALGFFTLDSNGNYAFDGGGVDKTYQFGLAGDYPVAGDWDGNGTIKLGVFRCPAPGAGICTWYLDENNNGVWDGTFGGDITFQFGLPGDIPVVGDWTGNGVSKVGVMRCPAVGQPGVCSWYLDTQNLRAPSGTFLVDSYGLAGDQPAVGNWAGTGGSKPVDNIGVFRNGLWIVDSNGSGAFETTDAQFSYGIAGDTPVTGNWQGSANKRIGVFRCPAAGVCQWILNTSGSGAFSPTDLIFQFGLTGDKPVVGFWTLP